MNHAAERHLRDVSDLNKARAMAMASMEVDLDLLRLAPEEITRVAFEVLELVVREGGDHDEVQLLLCGHAMSAMKQTAWSRSTMMVDISEPTTPEGDLLMTFAGVPVRCDRSLTREGRPVAVVMACPRNPRQAERRARAVDYLVNPPLQFKEVEKVVEKEVLVERAVDSAEAAELERRRREDAEFDRRHQALCDHLRAIFGVSLTVGAIAWVLYSLGVMG